MILNIRFNVIGKLETMKEDVDYIINASNLNISLSSFPRINSHSSHSNEHKLLSLRYFREIDEESVKKLYDIYKIDFEMFGYTVDDYLLKTKWIQVTVTMNVDACEWLFINGELQVADVYQSKLRLSGYSF